MTKSQPCNLKGWTRGGVDKGWFTLYVKNWVLLFISHMTAAITTRLKFHTKSKSNN
jgi:hypothetical protein